MSRTIGILLYSSELGVYAYGAAQVKKAIEVGGFYVLSQNMGVYVHS